MRPNIRTSVCASIVLSAALFTAGSGCSDDDGSSPAPSREPARKAFSFIPQPALAHAAGSGQAVNIADVAETALPSVVSVASTRVVRSMPFDDPFLRRFFGPTPEQQEHGLGSGVVVGKGVVVTNSHVVAQAEEIVVSTADGRQFDATVAGTDPQSDIAVLKLKGDTANLKVASFGDSQRLRLGDVVLAVGNPFGVGQTVTMGIVSAKGRADVGIADYEDFIQTDAAINPGNSGGALVDMEGRVIGINTAILSRTGGYMGIGFAVPSEMVKPIVKSLVEHGKVMRGWLGVSVQNVDRDIAKAFDLTTTSGALISEIEPGSPAAKAGLVRGDVVVAVNGTPVESTGRLRNLIAASRAKETVTLDVIRRGKPKTVSVKLEEMPSRAQPPVPTLRAPQAGEQKTLDGLTVEALSSSLRDRLGIPESIKSGVVVLGIEPGAAAARAGLRPGDVILEVDRRPVSDAENFRRLWSEGKGEALLLVWRAGRTLFIVVRR